MRAQEFLAESKLFILYINGKPAAKYQDEAQALRDIEAVRAKHPSATLELKHEVCDFETVRRINEYKINNANGIGAVPYNKDVDYFGLRVAMRPSTFLKLALPMNNSREDQASIEHIIQHKDTEGIGAPFLTIEIPQSWEEGNLKEPARVIGHDGRHRMAAILKSEGDEPVETHLFPRYLRRRDFDANPEWVQALNKQIISQRKTPMSGPFFQENEMNEAMFEYIDTVEDLTGTTKPGSRPGTIKHKAAAYLGKGDDEKLSPTDLKRLRAKANKMKTSERKASRQSAVQLSKQASWYGNHHK